MPNNQFDDNQTLWAGDLNAATDALGAGGIISGCSISKGTGDWDIDVTSGQIIESNTEASISSGTVTITDSSGLTGGQSRVTLIHADTGDALASTDGSAAADPATPDIPAGEVLLGFVVVSNGDSTVADSDIFDIPALRLDDTALIVENGSHELDADAFAAGNGTDGEFLTTDGTSASWGPLVAQSPQDVASSRSAGTWFQNTTGNPLIVMATMEDTDGATAAQIFGHINTTQSDNEVIGSISLQSETSKASITMVVPNQSYYKVENDVNDAIDHWFEQELSS